MPFRRLCWPPCLIAATLAIAAPGAAQLTEKEAEKALRAGVKAEVKDLRVGVKGAVGAMDAALKSLTRDAAAGSFGTAQEVLLGSALEDLREDLQLAVGLGAVELVTLVDQLLTDLGSPADGSFPAGFYRGEGSTLGAFDAAVHAEQEKALRKLQKKFRKLAAALEKNGIGFTWRLIFAFREFAWSYNPGHGAPFQGNQLQLAFAYAMSDLAVPDDGTLCVGGTGPSAVATLDIEIIGGHSGGTLMLSTADDGDPGFFECFTAVEEGNYLIEVRIQGVAQDERVTSLGVR